MKLLGMVFVLLGGIGIGWYFAAECKLKLHAMKELERSLHLLEGEVSYAACDMVEILGKLASRAGYFQRFWDSMRSRLMVCEAQTFSKLWEQETKKYCNTRVWKKEEYSYFLELGNHLGNLDRQTQIHTLELFEDRLHHRICIAEEQVRVQMKICRVVGVTGALFTAILFL